MPITKRDVDGLEPNSLLWDQGRGSVTGFGVRRQRRDAVFIIKFASAGRSRWYTIGRFGSPWTVETARVEARKLLGHVAEGRDPGNEKQSLKHVKAATLSVAEVCEKYLEAAEAGLILTRFKMPKKARTLEDDQGRIARHIRPLIGTMAITDLDSRAVRRMVADITAGKTAADEKTKLRGRAIVRGGPATAARVADLLSGIMAWAIEEDLITTNPVHGVRRHRSPPRERYLADVELQQLGTFLRHSRTNSVSTFHPFALDIIEILVMTGCRLSEISGLRWTEVDVQDGCLRLADTKTGRSMRAVGSVVIDILHRRDRQTGSQFVFPASRGPDSYQGTKRQAGQILAAAGIEGASSHTLRHTYASIASGLGYSDATIAGLLGHAGRGVTSRYVHRPDEALKSAAEAVSQRIRHLLIGPEGEERNWSANGTLVV